MSQKTITINGTLYDAHTGLALDRLTKTSVAVSFDPKPASSARTIHATTQKSITLNRSAVKKSSHHIEGVRKHIAVTKSPLITKFAPHPAGAKLIRNVSTPDIAVIAHPFQHKANQSQSLKKHTETISKPSQMIKNEAISSALKQSHTQKEAFHKKQPKKHSRFLNLASAGLALLLLAGYFTYINMPNLSVRVASSQAGIAASYPEYHPDGYSLTGPVAYTQGEVSMKFAANSGSSDFTIRQSKSSWDSSAVLDNHVKQNAGDNYVTYNERGLTIYTYGSNAVWVNRGILYTIDGNAPLSSEQIRHIATSM